MTGTIVVAATPTSNGDLHVGHMAGPYLAGDVYTRYLRACGREVIYTTCTDDSQSYVLTTAHRLGTTPEELSATSTAAIQRSLAAMGISIAGLPPIGAEYRRAVLEFVTALHAAGRFRRRTVRLPVATRSGAYLFDGLISGTCPVCLAGSSGGVCEGCGHPNLYDELLDPHSTMDPSDPVAYRDTTILVLPLEDHRDRLTAHFAAQRGFWRTHAIQLIDELLAKPLPEVPVTIPGTWGIRAPFPETPGQMLYPWVEGVPAVMYGTWWAAGDPSLAPDAHWRAESGAEVVYFHGFDNVYHWGLMDLAFLVAHGDRYVTPIANVCNEFYDLDGEKFSTSRNHLIWSVDLLSEVPRDLVRFHLALTAPEQSRTNFTRESLHDTGSRLVEAWNGLADALAVAVGRNGSALWPTTAAGRGRAAAMLARFRSCYELSSYSMNRAAETVLTQLARLRGLAGDSPAAPGDLLLEVRTLLAGAGPILIDAAGTAAAAGVDLGLAADPAGTVEVFELPRLPEEASHEAAGHRDPAVPELLPLAVSAGASVRGGPVRDERRGDG